MMAVLKVNISDLWFRHLISTSLHSISGLKLEPEIVCMEGNPNSSLKD